jgi:hypothetical protein
MLPAQGFHLGEVDAVCENSKHVRQNYGKPGKGVMKFLPGPTRRNTAGARLALLAGPAWRCEILLPAAPLLGARGHKI